MKRARKKTIFISLLLVLSCKTNPAADKASVNYIPKNPILTTIALSCIETILLKNLFFSEIYKEANSFVNKNQYLCLAKYQLDSNALELLPTPPDEKQINRFTNPTDMFYSKEYILAKSIPYLKYLSAVVLKGTVTGLTLCSTTTLLQKIFPQKILITPTTILSHLVIGSLGAHINNTLEITSNSQDSNILLNTQLLNTLFHSIGLTIGMKLGSMLRL
jgi:hypothetical protein